MLKIKLLLLLFIFFGVRQNVFADPIPDPYHPRVVYTEGAAYSSLHGQWQGPARLLQGTADKPATPTNPGVASMMGALSSDGRWAAFVSSRKLTDGAVEGQANVYVMNMAPGTAGSNLADPPCCIELVSVIAPTTDPNRCDATPEARAAEPANGPSFLPSISGDGRFVAFVSKATNLVEHMECGSAGTPTPASSAPDGSRQVYVRDRKAGTTTLISGAVDPTTETRMAGDGYATEPSISADGRYIAYVAQTKTGLMTTGITNLFSFSEVYLSRLSDLQTARISSDWIDGKETDGIGNSMEPVISSDGRFVAFSTQVVYDANRATGDKWNIVRYESALDGKGDVIIGQRKDLQYVSLGPDGHTGDGDSMLPSISADGDRIAYTSEAGNLIVGDPLGAWPADTNGFPDVYVRAMNEQRQQRVSLGYADWLWNLRFSGPPTNPGPTNQLVAPSFRPAISGDGHRVLFTTLSDYVLFDQREADFQMQKIIDLSSASTDSCYSALTGGVDTYWGWPMHETDPPSPPITISPAPAGRRFAADVVRLGCLPAISPDYNGTRDVYLAYLDDQTLLPISVSPVSVSDWRFGYTSYEQTNVRNSFLPAGSEYWVQEYTYARHGFFQAYPGNGYSTVSSPQALSFDGASMLFDTTADNLQVANAARADAENAQLAGSSIVVNSHSPGATSFYQLPSYGMSCLGLKDGKGCQFILEDQNNSIDVYYFSPSHQYSNPVSGFGQKLPPWIKP